MTPNQIILVDENDQQIGTEEKLRAHQNALLHRAFSVFIYRKHEHQYEILLQQRNSNKYHSGGLWTNTCCSHPTPGETTIKAGERRLFEEMGIRTSLKEIGSFIYKASVGNNLIEHEYDHVLLGEYADEPPNIDASEISAYRWISISECEDELNQYPEKFTSWFKKAFSFVLEQMHTDHLVDAN
ncbi:MAG: isopentenyl-diphosphate Delta-isomerase [Gammaproteobacteria bacterium]